MISYQDSVSEGLLGYLQRLFARSREPADLKQLLQQIADQARDLTRADLVVVYAINPISASEPVKRKFLLPPTISGALHFPAEKYVQAPRPDGVTQQVLEKGALFADDSSTGSTYQSTFVISEGIKSFAAIPLRLDRNNKLLGIMYVDYHDVHEFSNSEKENILTFAAFAAEIMNYTWYLRRYQEISRIGEDINRDISTFELIVEKLQKHLPGIINAEKSILLAIFKPNNGKIDIHLVENSGYLSIKDDSFEGGCRWVIETGEPLLIREFTREKPSLEARGIHLVDMPIEELRAESLIFVPLLLRNTDQEDAVPLGAFSVQHDQPNVYDEEDLRLIQALAQHLALAISSIRLFSGLVRLTQSGQLLTRHLTSEQLLDRVVDEIKQVTESDIVVLYPYHQATGKYELPPRQRGDLLAPDFPAHLYVRPDDMATLTVKRSEPVFARRSANLYGRIGGDPARRLGNFEVREQIASTAALPLRVGDEPVGALFINYRVRQRFDAPQKQLIQSLANYAAIAIRNARVLGSVQDRHIKELELLRDIDNRIGNILELDRLLQEILELVGEHISVDEASILLYDSEKEVLDTVASIGRHAETSKQQKVSLDDKSDDSTNRPRGIVRDVFRQKEPIRIENVRTNPLWKDKHLDVASDTISELDVPIFRNGEVIGIINMESTREAAFSQKDEDFLVTLAGQAVLAINNAEAYEREKRIAEERQALVDIGKEIASTLDRRRVFDAILQKALDVTRCQAGNLMLYDPRRNDLWMAAERGVMAEKIGSRQSLHEGIVGQVATTQQLLNVDVCSPPWQDHFLSFIPNVCSELAVPLLEGDRLYGVLNIESIERRYFNERDERLLQALADMAVIALRNVEQFGAVTESKARLQALSQVDIQIIAQADDPDAVMQAIAENALLLTQADTADLGLFYGGEVSVNYFSYRDESKKTLINVSKGQEVSNSPRGIVAHVVKTKQPYWTQGDAQQDDYYTGNTGIHSEATIPLLTQDEQLIGVLDLDSKEIHAFSAEDAEILQLLAGQAVIAYNLAQSYARSQSERKRFQILYQVGEEIAELADVSDVRKAYEIVANRIAGVTPGEVIIRRYDGATQELVLAHSILRRKQPPFERRKLDDGVSGWVARERRTMVVHDLQNPPEGISPRMADPATRSVIITPILFGERYYGNLSLSDNRPNVFVDADIELIKGLARQLALTLYRIEITEASNLAEQRVAEAEVMSAMGQSASELAHRLGNDLGLIRTYVENIGLLLMSHNIEIEELVQELAKIQRDATKVLDLSSGLKEIFREYKDGKRPKQAFALIPPLELLKEAVLSQPEIPTNIHVQIHVEPEVASVYADHAQVANILRNLFSNAIQAMPGGGSITLHARNAGRFVDLQVQDTGIGISEEIQARIFDLFYSTRGGMGFGLWSARRDALANRGDLKVTSKPGQGATFTLSLQRSKIKIGGMD